MAALTKIEARDAVYGLLVKRRKNWAAREAGVVVVFCIVFVVAAFLLWLCISRALARRRAARPQR